MPLTPVLLLCEFESRLCPVGIFPLTEGNIGAGSADFRRFINKFYQTDHASAGLGRNFYGKVWDWVRTHEDVQIVYQKEPRDLSLTEFEALELQETGANGADYSTERQAASSRPLRASPKERPLSFREALRQRLQAEGHGGPSATPKQHALTGQVPAQSLVEPTNAKVAEANPALSPNEANQDAEQQEYAGPRVVGKRRGPRKVPKGIIMKTPFFDDPPDDLASPRIFVSQNRTWQAVAGHPIDFKKVPSMSFMLLSIIAMHGEAGVIQPDLVRLSGQDKRSVPGRTDTLAKDGYIVKKPVQAGKLRTSLCVHKKFVKEGHFLSGPTNVEHVFRDGTLILSSFVGLLYNILKEPGFIPWKDLRTKMVS